MTTLFSRLDTNLADPAVPGAGVQVPAATDDDPTAHPLCDMRWARAELRKPHEQSRLGPTPAATERQHARGKLPVPERLELLLAPGSFTEIEPLRRHRASGFGLERNRPYGDGV